jgi:RNA polymerase sigma-70 factor (ECF subfamily)
MLALQRAGSSYVMCWPGRPARSPPSHRPPCPRSTAPCNARATLRRRWPGGRLDWAPSAEPDAEQSKLLQRYIDAHELADPRALIEVLHDDVRLSISRAVGQWTGREQVADTLRANMNILGRWRLLPITANRQPGAAVYLRRPGEDTFRPFAICVLRIQQGKLIDIAAFEQPSLFPAFSLPPSL